MTTALPKVITIKTAEENREAQNKNRLKNFSSRIYTASGSFIRFISVLAIATILATPLPFIAMRLAIGMFIAEFLLIPLFIAILIGIPVGVAIYIISFIRHKPMINFHSEDTDS